MREAMPRHIIVQKPPISRRLPVMLGATIAAATIVGLFQLVAEKNKQLEALATTVTNMRQQYGVTIVDNNGNFVCKPPTGIRREWEAVIGQKCKELAGAMYAARSKP
jgi:hypothetical protein